MLTVAALAVCGVAYADPLMLVVIPTNVMDVDSTMPPNAEWAGAKDSAAKRLVQLAKQNAQTFGFQSPPADENALTVLQPFGDAVVQIDKLKAFLAATDPETLIERQPRLIFPVAVRGKLQSSFTLMRRGGAWIPAEYGSANLIRAAMNARISLVGGPTSRVLPGRKAEYTLVTVNGINEYFLYAKGTSGPYLTPLYDNRNNWKPGQPIRAKDALLKLVRDAKAYKPLPPQ
jgi:hypothetical protein